MKMFSLIEVMVVVAVIAMIAAMVVPLMVGGRNTVTAGKREVPKGYRLRRTLRKVYLLPIGVKRLTGWLPGARFSPQVQFANIAEGSSDRGLKSYIPDAAISRYNIVKQGSDDVHVAVSAANTDIPLGVSTDSSDAANLDLPITIGVFGAVAGTQRVVLGGTVAAGDFLQSNGDGTALKLKTTTGSWYKIGRALMAGVSGDTIEFAPCMPDLVVVP